MSKPRLIAFYLPQYYPTKENNEWWGSGFTEWTNVSRGRPLFKGHIQPKIPGELGFYDLRLVETREEQVRLAKEAGIEGFCYWHYWFNGKRLLDRVFSEVVETRNPDFPFCLCWANHSWERKTWDDHQKNKMLIEQTYGGEKDYINHFYSMLKAFKDERYIKVNGKLIFGIFNPTGFDDFSNFKRIWDKLAVENELKGFEFFGFASYPPFYEMLKNKGYDAVSMDYIYTPQLEKKRWYRGLQLLKRNYLKIPQLTDYKDYIKSTLKSIMIKDDLYPIIVPNFDHSPRSGTKGVIIVNSTPQLWGNLCKEVFRECESKPHEENIIFIKAWNEWGEGNYLEPDLLYGKAYIEALNEALKSVD